jgi:O-antigen/teichoic acid export membrane protein
VALTREGRRGPVGRLLSSASLPGGMVPVATGLIVLGLTAYGFLVLAARSLGPERYAPLSVLWALVFLVGPGVFVPLEQELARAISASDQTGGGVGHLVRKAAVAGAGIAGLLLVATAVAGVWITSRLFDHDVLLLVGLLLSLAGYYAEHLVRGILAGNGRFRVYGLILGTEGTIRLLGCGILAVAGVSGPGPYGLVLGAAPLVAAAVGARGQHLFSPALTATAGVAPPPAAASWAGPSLTQALGWLLAGSLFAQLLVNGPPVVVKLLATAAEKATVGRFVAGLIVARVPLFLFASVQASALPRLSRFAAAGQDHEFKTGLRHLLLVVGAFGLAGTLGAAVAGPLVVRIMFGPAFRLGRGDLVYLAAATGLYMMAMTVAQGLIALCAQARVAIAWLAGFVAFVVVVVVSPGLLPRVERGLLGGSAVAFGVMAVTLAPLLRTRARHAALVSEEPGFLPPAVP